MEDSNTNKCKNNYTEDTYFTEFAKDDECIKKCSKCSNFVYEDGMITCSLFNKEGRQ